MVERIVEVASNLVVFYFSY